MISLFMSLFNEALWAPWLYFGLFV